MMRIIGSEGSRRLFRIRKEAILFTDLVKMTKLRISTALLLLAFIAAWLAGISRSFIPHVAERAGCRGYTIIEYGKGINCLGDTVILEKKGGLQMLGIPATE